MEHRGLHVPGRRYIAKTLRIAGATLVVILLAAAMSAGGLYFLLRGEAVRNSSLNESIEANIQQLLGSEFEVDLGSTSVAFDPDGLLSVAGTDVRILRAADRQPVSTLARVVVGVRPMSLLGEEPQIDAVIIENSTLDVRVLPLLGGIGPVRDIKPALVELGKRFAGMGRQFERERFRLFRFSNVRISGLEIGAGKHRDVDVEELEIRFRQKSELALQGRFRTELSDVAVDGKYRIANDGGAELTLNAAGLNLREWLPDPFVNEAGPVGWDGIVSAAGSMTIRPDGTPVQPKLVVQVASSTLRLGRYARSPVDSLELNLRIIPEKNQIELDPSALVAGEFRARLVGGVRPTDPDRGYGGPLEFELIADPAVHAPTLVGEQSVPATIRLRGTMNRERRIIDIANINIVAGDDRADGSAIVGFRGETPSIAAAGASAGLPVAVVKQLWPYWLAPPARDWALKSLVGGRLSDVSLEARIPGGIVGRFHKGAKLKPDELMLRARFSETRFDTFGELPPIRAASGTLAIDGMTFRADLGTGRVFLPGEKPVRLIAGSFEVADYGERPARSEIRVAAEGDARALAKISGSKPLNVPARIKIRAEQISGEANIDVVTRLPIKKGLKAGEIDWNAIVETRKSALSVKYQNRNVADADLLIEVTPRRAHISGTADIDGLRTTLEMTEPVGKSDFKPERLFTAVVDEKARKKMGLTLDPVLSGLMKMRVEQKDGGPESYDLDLTGAELKLPWVGWTKGTGIAAQASFRLRVDGSTTHLDDFYLEGDGFSAAGTIAFDKSGVVSADFANVSLNQADSLAVRISRPKTDTYRITADGARFDARGLINKLIHKGGFGDAQGKTNVAMTANIGSVRGFGEQSLNNVSMSYGTHQGWFDNLSLRGAFSESEYVSIVASTTSRKTQFKIDTTNAGAGLRMVDVYRRMQGGHLVATLTRQEGGPFLGPFKITDFVVEDEPRLKRLVSDRTQDQIERGVNLQEVRRQLRQVDTNRVRFQEARAVIDKGDGYLRLSDGILSGSKIGFTFDGLIYDAADRMDLTGTFMPAMSLSRAIGFIPLVGDILGNGRDTSLIGITFRLTGPSKSPTIEVNPISVVAPGVFRKVFEFRN